MSDNKVKKKNTKELEKQLLDAENRWRRALADYQNLQKDVEKSKQAFSNYAYEQVLKEIIPVLNNFKRALNSNDKKDSFVEGVENIYKQLSDIVIKCGLEEMEVIGKEFSPEMHEAITTEIGKDNIILKEVESGYMFKDKVILPAKVIVGVEE